MKQLTKEQIAVHLKESFKHLKECRYCNMFFYKTMEGINTHRLDSEGK